MTKWFLRLLKIFVRFLVWNLLLTSWGYHQGNLLCNNLVYTPEEIVRYSERFRYPCLSKKEKAIFSENVHKFWIMYIQSIQFFKECANFCICNVHNIPKSLRPFVYSMYTNFQFYTFHVHYYIHSTYTIFQIMYIIQYIQCIKSSQNIHQVTIYTHIYSRL